MDNREAIEWLKGCVVAYEVDSKGKPNGNVTCELIQEVIDMAISALKEQEQTNTQNINSTHTSRPNALESLNILEQAKDDKGCVPMSLVRQAFRNVIEQTVDKCCETCKHKKRSTTDWPCIDCYLSSCQVEDHYEPYTEEES